MGFTTEVVDPDLGLQADIQRVSVTKKSRNSLLMDSKSPKNTTFCITGAITLLRNGSLIFAV